MPTKDKAESSDEEQGGFANFLTHFGRGGSVPVDEDSASHKRKEDDDDDDDDNDNNSTTKKKETVNKEKSQQYYDTETGGDEIIAVETDQDKNKKSLTSKPPTATSSKSRSLPTTSSNSSTGIDWSGCCNTKKKKWAWCGMFTVVLIVSIVLLAFSFKKLNSTEYGAEYNTHWKILDEAVKTGGLHAGPPGFEFIKFPSTFITVDLNDRTCVSQDGLLVEFDVTFQYQVPKEYLLDIIYKYRNFDKWAQVVEAAGSSAVHHACSEFTISNFQNKRGIIQSTMEDNLRLKLEGPGSIIAGGGGGNTSIDNLIQENGTSVVTELLQTDNNDNDNNNKGVYARAISLQLRNIELPSAYKDAVTEKQSAEEGIALAVNQRKQNVTKAETELKTSMEQARKIRDTAMNDANITLTQAKLKAEETTFAFTTEAQVLVRVKKSLNLTTDGVLAYLSNQLYATVQNLHVTVAEPAKVSRQEEL